MSEHKRWISKFKVKNGSWVFVPTDESIIAGRRIKAAIEDLWTPPANYYHLRNGGHVAAIKLHCKHKIFIHVDIKDFFGCINRSRVTRCLKKFFIYGHARCIALESTVRRPNTNPAEFILPFGFVQSPIIASLCFSYSTLGKMLRKISTYKNVQVSVYMDDIIVSLDNRTRAIIIFEKIKMAAIRSNFLLNEKKSEGPDIQISSFNINLSHDNIEIEQDRFLKFYKDYYISSNSNQMDGYRNYIKTVNLDQSKLLH